MEREIPVAERLSPPGAKAPSSRFSIGLVKLSLGLVFLVSLVGLGGWLGWRSLGISQAPGNESPESAPPENHIDADNILGHLAYAEAPLTDLQPISADSQIQLRSAAATKFREMVDAAQFDGVAIIPLSGFRSQGDQDYLFFEIKEQRAQGASERAQVSAPPGFSEHHTGYAVDIGDPSQTDTHLKVSFEETPAFEWMVAHAPRYSFELSFPRNNPQGISYEPWHWRFVGDRHSLETFYRARELASQETP
ncbi:D-alanyl-D-alanine carboxypeptidase family protein [Candidatus Synechococcus calcipolaris G9]|uniref:D-alanyl-D-alanine carboxypeptidase family protein n=1 Tax=Candidatus Synechococcus calcipolaris G9 TaxID=1497997 RepID=A0ABT6EZ23_9SYNE|nr:M15 family metallopeptidase [Candidatus Synechococcus calcipolaris]MDG2990470.1 D-alanyl-D-alanine carboxypeptidase family protein [Candidatus Synechococcus calcipolaris G9]